MKKTFFSLVALVATLMVSCTTSQSQQDATNNETENNFKIQCGTNTIKGTVLLMAFLFSTLIHS